jgi:radical SAM superfamily enzyme YgiQ (UPF0313 family)
MFSLEIARRRGYFAYPPMGLVYLAAVAHAVNPAIRVKILDLNFEMLKQCHADGFDYNFWKDLLWQELSDEETRSSTHIGVSCMFGATKPIFMEITAWLHQRFPSVPILVGGVQASYDFQELLEQEYADIVFLREAETSFGIFLRNCTLAENGASLAVPHGVSFRLDREVVACNSLQVPSLGEIDIDIRPFYSLVPISEYHRYGSLAAFSRYNGEDKPFATVLSNRGCRAQCTFCTVRDFNGRSVRQRDVQRVVDELKFLVTEYGIKQIDWLDDDLLYNPARTIALFKAMTEEVPDLEWICNNGLIGSAISEENMEWMVKSGMKALKIGIESGNEQWLLKIKKPTSKRKLLIADRIFKRYPDVFVSGNFIIGFPNETFGEMLDSYHFARQLGWDWASFYICQPLKGTELFAVFQSLGDERCDYDNYDKTLNPGRSAVRGEFGYHKGYHSDGEDPPVLTGKDVFKLPADQVPSKEQIKEIWFTFNLVTNFLENPSFSPKGNIPKMMRWFESIAAAYPFDASMIAALAYGHKLLSQRDKQKEYQERFEAILKESAYWQRRVQEFPELLGMVY